MFGINEDIKKPNTTQSNYDQVKNKIFLNPKFKSTAKFFIEDEIKWIDPAAPHFLIGEMGSSNITFFIDQLTEKYKDAHLPLESVKSSKPKNTDNDYQEFTSSLRDSSIRDIASLKNLGIERLNEYLDSIPEDYDVDEGVEAILEGDKHFFNHPDRAHEQTHKNINASEPLLNPLIRYTGLYKEEIIERSGNFVDLVKIRRIEQEFKTIHECNAIASELKKTSDKYWINRSIGLVSRFFKKSLNDEIQMFSLLNDFALTYAYNLAPQNEGYSYFVAELLSLFGEKIVDVKSNDINFLNLNFLFGENFLDESHKLTKDALFRASTMIMGQEIKALLEGDGELKRKNLTQNVKSVLEERTKKITEVQLETLQDVTLLNIYKTMHKDNVPAVIMDKIYNEIIKPKGEILKPSE